MRKFFRGFLSKLLARYRYKLVAANFHEAPVEDLEFLRVFEGQQSWGWSDKSGPKIQRIYNLINLYKMTLNIPGAIAECGVFKGSTSKFLLEYRRNAGFEQTKKIKLYDSFEGLAEPSLSDSGTNMRRGDYLGVVQEVKSNLAGYDNLHFYKGWIPHCFDLESPDRYSFVHIDVDFYEAVRDSLVFFGERMVSGGIIVFDDYGCYETPGAKKAVDEFANQSKALLVRFPFGQAAMIFR